MTKKLKKILSPKLRKLTDDYNKKGIEAVNEPHETCSKTTIIHKESSEHSEINTNRTSYEESLESYSSEFELMQLSGAQTEE
jgi:hypothetical protein